MDMDIMYFIKGGIFLEQGGVEWIVAQLNRSGFIGLGKIGSGSDSRTLQAGLGSGLDLALVGDVLEERRLGSVGVHDDQRLGE